MSETREDVFAVHDGGVIYAIQAEYGGPVKLGFCQKREGVEERRRVLQCGNPYPLVVRGVIPAPEGICTEQALHERLAKYRLTGEWFMPLSEVSQVMGVELVDG